MQGPNLNLVNEPQQDEANLQKSQIRKPPIQSHLKSGQSSQHSRAMYLHININSVEIRHREPFQDICFSILHKEIFHFTSAISHESASINDDIVIQLTDESQIPETLSLQRWQNHMVMFDHEVDIHELLNKKYSTKKKVETKNHEIVSLTLTLYYQQDLQFTHQLQKGICQQYLMIEKVFLEDKKEAKNAEINSPSFFEIFTKEGQKYVISVMNAHILLQIPDEFQFVFYKNGDLLGQSDWISYEEFPSSKYLEIGLFSKGSYSSLTKGILKMKVKWGSNLFSQRFLESNILHESHELSIYDIDIKFDTHHQVSNSKVKFIYSNKAYELNNESATTRANKFQRVIFILLKTEQEEVQIICEKNGKILAEARFHTAEFVAFKQVHVKKPIEDTVSHKQVGTIKFNAQKCKNASLPSNNSFWRACNKSKHGTNSKITLQIIQLSVIYQENIPLMGLIKTEREIFKIEPLTNLFCYQKELKEQSPVTISIQQKTSVYMVIKEKAKQFSSENDYIGIAIINYDELKLGLNCVTVPFYKDQQKIIEANCLINKILPYPFVKGVYQPDLPISTHTKTLSVSINLERVDFEAYFYTYLYERKSQVYCIFEVGKVKKVIVLQNSSYDALHFLVGQQSDSLNFIVRQSDFIKVKLTFLVSENGKEEQIYGSLTLRAKLENLLKKDKQTFINSRIKNEVGITLGSVSLEVKKGLKNSSEIVSNREMKKIHMDIAHVNRSLEKVEKSRGKKNSQPFTLEKKVLEKKPEKRRMHFKKRQDLTESIVFQSEKFS